MVAFIGPWEAVILFAVILLLFGTARFAGVAKGLGRGAREFKKSIKAEDEHPKLPPGEGEKPA
jgi:sec-independent protein translocase protein TatA